MVRLAAREMQSILKKISGAQLPIGHAPDERLPVTLYVGESDHTRRPGIDAAGRKPEAAGKYREALATEEIPPHIKKTCEKKLAALQGGTRRVRRGDGRDWNTPDRTAAESRFIGTESTAMMELHLG